jgi:hypothetical protein
VVVSGLLLGSCANCHYGGEGGRCSFRRSKLLSISIKFIMLLSGMFLDFLAVIGSQ